MNIHHNIFKYVQRKIYDIYHKISNIYHKIREYTSQNYQIHITKSMNIHKKIIKYTSQEYRIIIIHQTISNKHQNKLNKHYKDKEYTS